MLYKGTERNWRVVGLTAHNTVLTERVNGKGRATAEPEDTGAGPSEYFGIEYLTRLERAIIRRGVTSTGRDRRAPK